MSTLVTSLGHTPAIVLEGLGAIIRSGHAINKICLLYTKRMKKQLLMLKLALKYGGFESINLEAYELPFEELKSEEECLKFRYKLYELVNKEREVKLLISGGRKSNVVDFVLVALAFGIKEVYHVIPKRGSEIYLTKAFADSINLELYVNKEPPKHIIDQILNICNPDLRNIHLIRIPLPTTKEEFREALRKDLSSLAYP